MKRLVKNLSLLLLISSITTTCSISAMHKYNNNITVINENRDALSLLQMSYHQIEAQPANSKKFYSVGITTVLNGPEEFKCRLANKKNKHDENYSLLRISDPRGVVCKNGNTKKWNTSSNVIKLKVSENDTVTVHAKNDNNKVIIKLNGTPVGSVQY